ncbi:MAG: DNA primase [Simplicispira sp.]|nr:DNA primase [Simplicispira sp.]
MTIPQSFIQELLDRTDIVDVVGRYVQLKKGGANFMGLCPFHGEKSPSFSVSPAKQFFHCFGCSKNGNAITFLMEHTGMGFVEAVHDLAQQTGLQVPQDDVSPQERERAAAQKQQQATLTEVLEKAGDAYRQHLRTAAHAVDYLKGRGVSGAVAKRFGLGYAPQGWHGLASVFAHYDDPLLQEAGLVIVNDDNPQDVRRYDRFRDRLMFPIRNVKGECIGFGGRVLGDDKPKYLNSPETPVFHKGRELYGLFEARTAIREQGFALVTEGYMDVVALAQLGFPNAVATLGTACTPEHLGKLFRFTETVVFSFDGDSAGRRAARKALDNALAHASDTRSIKFLFLPAEHDPDSFVRAHGSEAFARHIAQAVPLSAFLLEAASEQCDLATPEGRAHMTSNARPLWELLPDGVLKRQLLGEVAALAQLDARDLSDVWSQARAREAARTQGGMHAARHAGPPPEAYTGGSPEDFPPASSYAPYDASPAYGEAPPFQGTARSGRRTGARPSAAPTWGSSQPRSRAAPASRADHAARLLLSHMDFLDALTQEDHAALCALAAPHGPLFTWLEGQFHEHGVRTWAQLREDLHGHACQAIAERVMAGGHISPEGATPELRTELQTELRALLNRMLIEQIKRQQDAAIAEAAHDPGALQRYRTLQAQRVALEKLAAGAS